MRTTMLPLALLAACNGDTTGTTSPADATTSATAETTVTTTPTPTSSVDPPTTSSGEPASSTSSTTTTTTGTTTTTDGDTTTGPAPLCVIGDPLVHVQTAHLPGRGMTLAWKPDSTTVAAGGHFKDPATQQRYDTKLYDVATGAHLKSFDCHYYWVIGLTWANNPYLGEVLATAGYDHAVKLWDAGAPGSASCDPGQFDPAEGALIKLPELDGATTGLAFSPDGRFLAATNRDRTVRLWDLAPGPRQHKVVMLWYDEPAGNFLDVQWSPNGDRILTGDKQAGRVAVWTFDPAVDLWDDATVDAFAMVGYENQGSFYNQNQDKVTRAPLWSDGDHGSVWHVRYSPDGARVAMAAADKAVSVFAAETGALQFRAEAPEPTEFHSLDWHPAGAYLAAGGVDKNIHIFNAADGAHHETLTGHADTIPSVAWSPDGCMLASTAGGKRVSTVDEIHTAVAGPDQTIRIWSYGGTPIGGTTGDPDPSTSGPDETTNNDPSGDPSGDPETTAPGTTGDPDEPAPMPPGPETFQGFGATTPGGAGGTEIHITEPTDAAVRAAFKQADAGNAILVFDVGGPIDIGSPLLLNGDFVTIDGRGVTLDGTALGSTEALLDVRGHDVIVQDMRLRNGGDNLRAQESGAYNIVFSHISSTGAMDDGLSIGYGAHDITVQYCLFAGNTRSLFLKYNGTTDVTLHHNWFMKYWIRGPLVYDAFADLRNNIVEDWTLWGTRFENNGHGNAINNLWRLSDAGEAAGGKVDATVYAYGGADPQTIHVAGNQFEGNAVAHPSLANAAPAPFPAPMVTTHDIPTMTNLVESKAGCLPRDSVDQAYIDLDAGWDVADGDPLRL